MSRVKKKDENWDLLESAVEGEVKTLESQGEEEELGENKWGSTCEGEVLESRRKKK